MGLTPRPRAISPCRRRRSRSASRRSRARSGGRRAAGSTRATRTSSTSTRSTEAVTSRRGRSRSCSQPRCGPPSAPCASSARLSGVHRSCAPRPPWAMASRRSGRGCCFSRPAGVVSRPSPLPTEVLMTTTSLLPDIGTELREGYAQIGNTNLHYVEAGDGPLIVLLHGFPEFWFGWRLQIEPLAAAGFRVVAPDTRCYNLSSKPEGFQEYGVDLLADDIRGLIGELGAEPALLVGHDWGGSIAWTTAMNHPAVVDRLAILNAAHPRRL